MGIFHFIFILFWTWKRLCLLILMTIQTVCWTMTGHFVCVHFLLSFWRFCFRPKKCVRPKMYVRHCTVGDSSRQKDSWSCTTVKSMKTLLPSEHIFIIWSEMSNINWNTLATRNWEILNRKIETKMGRNRSTDGAWLTGF